MKTLRERYPAQVALTYMHFPLPGHRFAELASRAAECAGNQARFEAMQTVLFERQQEFGLRPWSKFALEAGIPDAAAFDACLSSSDPAPRIVEGKALGAKLDIQGTPTVIVNGWRLTHPPTLEELNGMLKRVLAGKGPVAFNEER